MRNTTICLLSFIFCLLSDLQAQTIDKQVNTYIGTGGHGHTFLGVSTPFGAIQVGLQNIHKGWDWCSGYHYSDSITIGFSHLHLNGTGCAEGGDLIFMPYTGDLKTRTGSQENHREGYASLYRHENEKSEIGYYSVLLNDYNVKVELTASNRVAFHRYTFPKENISKQVIINLKDANGGEAYDCHIEQIDDYTVQGYRFSRGWSPDQQVYFTATFSQKIEFYDHTIKDGKKTVTKTFDTSVGAGKTVHKEEINEVKANILFDYNTKEVSVKIGISPVSVKNAAANIKAEIPHWDFEKVRKENVAKWNSELGKTKIKTQDKTAETIFYTALYHAFIQPNLFNDYNKDYRGSDKKVYRKANFTNYTVFSLWDTYRAAHPLYTILQPERVPDFINSFLAIYEQTGILPVWHLYGADTKEMIGIQSIPVIADAILKGFKGFDYEKAFEAMKASMLSDYKGLNYVQSNKFIPADKEGETVAKGLEYAIADWAIAQVAKKLGKTEDYKRFSERAKYYQLYWDKNTNFFRGHNADGSLRTPFDPFRSTHRRDDYCEGNAWQYTWLVPQDVEGLISLFGSEKAFVAKLDSLFALNESLLGDNASPDISGLIGQYAHGNEPSHATVYLYAFAGEQWKTAEKVRQILSTMYFNAPNGLAGNEDCGQMSSWYIFSAMGFYPVNPSNGVYVFGSPLFDEVMLSLPNKKDFTITTKNNSAQNIYIQSVKLNGKPYEKSYITHEDIMRGSTLEFTMGATPNKSFGRETENRPKSER